MAHHTPKWIGEIDLWAVLLCPVLAVWMLRYPQHRRLPLLAYTWGFVILFLMKMNWDWGAHDEVIFSQSFGRYALVLFPLTILVADRSRWWPERLKRAIPVLLVLGVLIWSARHVMVLSGP